MACKKKVPPGGYTRHHRKPESLGGKTNESNVSIVLRTEHKAWTVLFDNLPATEVAKLFERYFEMFGSDSKFTYEARQIGISVLKELELLHEQKSIFDEVEISAIKKILGTYRSKIKKARAWRILFSDMSLEEIVGKINKVWIDPAYNLVIESAQIKKIIIRKS